MCRFKVILFLTITLYFPMSANGNRITCIIGAGASGVSFSAELAAMMYRKNEIHLFEKNSRVGGKCESLVINGHTIEMGAILVAPNSRWIRYYADSLGYRFIPHPKIQALLKNGKSDIYKIMELQDYFKIPKITKPIDCLFLINDFIHYSRISNKIIDKDRHIFTETITSDFLKNNNGDLKSFLQFLIDKDLKSLTPWFLVFISSFGYLSLNDIPAIYGFGYVSDVFYYYLWITGLISTKRLEKGYGELLAGIIETHHDKITLHSSSRVVEINRTLPEPYLVYIDQITNEKKEIDCDSFVIATEPGEAIELFDNPTEIEIKMKDKLKFSSYRTIVLKSNIPYGVFTLPHESATYNSGSVVLIANVFYEYPMEKGFRDTIFYIIETKDSMEKPLVEVVGNIKEQMATYGFSVQDEIKEERSWKNYFPHYDNYKIVQKLESNQGKSRTYYIGPAYSTFELVDRAFEHSTRVAHDYFSDCDHPVPSNSRFLKYMIPLW